MGLFVFAFWIFTQGERGELRNPFLLNTVFPALRTFNGTMTNLKFKLRGPEAPKNSKIVIVEVDSASIEKLGRWPWHRDLIGYLIDRTFESGAKGVALDAVFSEPDQRIPEQIAEEMRNRGLGDLVKAAETDFMLEEVIKKYPNKLVLGWATEGICQPAFRTSVDECPVEKIQSSESPVFPEGMERFGFDRVGGKDTFQLGSTPTLSLLSMISNLPLFSSVAKHQGYFFVEPDPDGYVRKTPLMLLMNGNPLPSLALSLAKIELEEQIGIDFDSNGKVKWLGFENSKRQIPTSAVGAMEINFRGPARTFPYVSAFDVMSDEKEIPIHHGNTGRSLASSPRETLMKDALVLIGVSAVGVFDMRAFPFDSNTPGVEGHANILDNLLAGDMLTSTTAGPGYFWILILMSVGAILIAYMTERLDSVKALGSFIGAMAILGFIDVYVLFTRNQVNWNTSLLITQLSAIFIFTISAKYVLEEKSKKFIKGAFSKYVSAAVVDAIVKNPDKLSLGGDKKDLSIMFSDIRGFTTLSEKMDPKALTGFLNTYLTDMTKIVFNTKGTLDKYIGDAVMAFWGAPIDMEDHADQACEAAIQMQRKLDAERDRFKKEFGINVEVGIGINSGVVSVGNMGSNDNLSYTVIGDDVNLASRLEGLTKYYGVKIVTTRQTIERIESKGKTPPPHRTLDFVKVKGKKQAVEIIQVLEKEYPAQGLALFTEARGLYAIREWDAAIAKFKQAIEATQAGIGEVDGPSEMYLERCEYFKQNPPAANWDGSWEMTSK